jgi:hypothetical protein
LSSTTSGSSETARSPQRGQILVLFAGGIVVLLLIAALVYDVGMMLVERRDQQNAADAAALAGARYVIADPDNARTVARDLARLNGFDDADPNEVVNVYIPPMHGIYKGFPNMIEVQIQGTRPSIFGGIIGKAAWPVGVFATASDDQELRFPFSMLALSETACKAIQVSGSGIVEAFANIHSNSSGSDCTTGPAVGFSRTGGSTINVYADDATCRAVGAVQDEGSGTMTCTPAGNSFALPDPLQDLDAPAKPPLAPPMGPVGHTMASPDWCPGATGSKAPRENQTNPCDVGGNGGSYRDLDWILYPGLYPAGLNVTNGATAYLMPGIYWIGGGGMRISGDGSLISIAAVTDAHTDPALATWGGGVLIYNSSLPTSAGADVSFDGTGANMKLKPFEVDPAHPDAIYNSIVIFQDRTVTATLNLNGSDSHSQVEGLIYLPAGEVVLNGNGGELTVDQIIANTFKINGNAGEINVLNGTGIDSVVSAAGLVE